MLNDEVLHSFEHNISKLNGNIWLAENYNSIAKRTCV